MNNDFDNRFGGTRRLYGNSAVELYRHSHICVVGIGGVGAWVAEALARSAVGQITLIDLDDLCVTNTNRQIHALTDTIGQSKVQVMAQRIQNINPECVVHEVEDFITLENIEQLISDQFDYVIDAIDSVKEKAALIAFCSRRKVPVITVGGAGGLTDPTQVQVADLNRTQHDPLAANVRATLRRKYGFTRSTRRFAIECVYSPEQLVYPQPDGSVCATKTLHDGNTRLDCAGGFGASVCVTATFGFVAVSRVLKKMVERAQRRGLLE